MLSQLPVIGRFTGPGLHPLSGSKYTVKAVGRGFGPSERLTWNFANFDDSTLNLVTGESGIFLSPYYLDQWKAWYGGSTFVFPFSQAGVERHRAHRDDADAAVGKALIRRSLFVVRCFRYSSLLNQPRIFFWGQGITGSTFSLRLVGHEDFRRSSEINGLDVEEIPDQTPDLTGIFRIVGVVLQGIAE